MQKNPKMQILKKSKNANPKGIQNPKRFKNPKMQKS